MAADCFATSPSTVAGYRNQHDGDPVWHSPIKLDLGGFVGLQSPVCNEIKLWLFSHNNCWWELSRANISACIGNLTIPKCSWTFNLFTSVMDTLPNRIIVMYGKPLCINASLPSMFHHVQAKSNSCSQIVEWDSFSFVHVKSCEVASPSNFLFLKSLLNVISAFCRNEQEDLLWSTNFEFLAGKELFAWFLISSY